MYLFPDRLVVGQRFLEPLTEVRILVGEHKNKESDALAFGDFFLVSCKDSKDGGPGPLHPSGNKDLGWQSRGRKHLDFWSALHEQKT